MDLLQQQKQNHSREPKLPIHSAHADKIGQAPLPRCRKNKEQRKLSDVWSLRFQLQKLDEKGSSQTTYDTFGNVPRRASEEPPDFSWGGGGLMGLLKKLFA